MRSVILGLSGPYHELAACLVLDGVVTCMIEEERLSRVRHGKAARIDNGAEWPIRAAEHCLADAGLDFAAVDHIAYPFVPEERLRNIGSDPHPESSSWSSEDGERRFVADVLSIEGLIRAHAGQHARFRFHHLPHHLAHAASAFLPSPFSSAAVMAVDGIGEHDTTWLGRGDGDSLQVLQTLQYPHSLGLLWEAVSEGLGFGPYGATKVMGLAAHGNPTRYAALLAERVTLGDGGVFTIDGGKLRFREDGPGWVAREVPEALVRPGQPIGQAGADLAAALQKRTEEVLIHLAGWLQRVTGSPKLCLAGGVALNCAANGRLASTGLFEEIFAQPAANDAGTALGAALLLHHRMHRTSPRWRQTTARLGPKRSQGEVLACISKTTLSTLRVLDPAEEAAERLARSEVVGWYASDRGEAGPRALGGRSMVADPRRPELRDHLNVHIKHRETFRPFGPAILAEQAEHWLALPPSARPLTPFMLAAVPVRPEQAAHIPAVVHKDGTTRPQLVAKDGSTWRRLIERFFLRSGVPMVLNTSLNVQEPIVESPEQALRLVADCGLDALLLDDHLVVKPGEPVPRHAPAAALRFEPTQDRYGTRLALVFGNEAKDGACPYHRRSECSHCDIGAGEGQAVSALEHALRLQWFAYHYRRELPMVRHLVLYNSGSLLNPREMSEAALCGIVDWAAQLPSLHMLSLDTREVFVRRERLAELRKRLPSQVALRVIVGLESADDEVRLIYLNKRMPREAVERAVAEIAASGDNMGLWISLVFGPPGRRNEAASEDLLTGISYSVDLAQRYQLPIDFNIHPFYPSQRSLRMHPDHPRADLALLHDALASARAELAARRSDASLFVGWQDEAHDQRQDLRLGELRGRSAMHDEEEESVAERQG